MAKRKLFVSSNRTVLTYGYLYNAADWALEQAEATEEGRFYNCMSTIVLSAFCIEAYLNHLGSKLLPYWDDEIKKDISTANKLKIVCHHLGLTADFSRRPFQSFKLIMKFRNLVAHGSTVMLSEKGRQTLRDGERVKHPQTWWENQCKLATAKRWLADTESIVTQIHEAAEMGTHPFVLLSSSSHHAQKNE